MGAFNIQWSNEDFMGNPSPDPRFIGKYCPGNNMDVTTPAMMGAGVA